MLYRYSEVFRTLLIVADLVLVGGAWLASYWIRFHTGIPAPLGVPELGLYLRPLWVILPMWFLLFRSHRLYEPRRTESLVREGASIVRASVIGLIGLMALNFFVRDYTYSRGVAAAFAVLAPSSVIALRMTLRGSLRALRRRGYNLRYVVVVGGGRLAAEVIERIHAHPEAGLRVYGVLADGPAGPRAELRGVSVLAGYAALKQVLGRTRIDQVILALPREEWSEVEKVLADLEDEVVSVKLAPDLLHILTLRSSVENLDGLPVINLRDSPMVGWAAVQKRTFDLAVGSLALAVAAPFMGLIALAIWVTSGRPVLYPQQRMGLDARVFRMWKFRTMVSGADREPQPTWTTRGDPRVTRLGALLRRFSLDELPQLANVVRGEMSLVGPRPERPVFIEEFRREVPGYMLRMKVRAGMTGWAQIHGWRGDTSLQERVEHDIYYIQNWSPALDVWILVRTLGSVLFDRHAY